MTPERLNIALIGATGKVAAPAHLNGLRKAPNANLYAVCDIDADSVGELAEQTGAKAFTSLEAVLADPNVDAIDLVTPPFVHAEQTIAAAKAGKHVYCEKPMAHSLAEASAMVSAHQDAGTTLMVGESYVFHHPNVAARTVIDSGDIGDVLHIRETKGPWVMRPDEAQRLSRMSHEANAPWRVDPKLSGGGRFPWVMDHAPHFFATARYFAGGSDVTSVTAHSQIGFTAIELVSGTGAPTGQAITSVAWSFDNGIDSAWNQVESAGDVGFVTTVHGTKGTLVVYGEGGGAAPGFAQPPAVVLHRDGTSEVIDEGNSGDRVWLSNNNYYDASHQAALEHWVDSVIAGRPVRYSGEDGRSELAATLATIKSAEERRTIAPADVPQEWTAY
ncbi:MAG TPA: Gfo/Idh/MocA family oxidoreductase [Dehalococcoidia bacterium]|jgi:predicted dehydrogenase|nr:Gfo/Idh/MocA family oxidoreductase [Dehalococcoidia bacterium]